MYSKSEDRLARLAFGDLSETEAAEMEAHASSDPKLRRTLDEYRSIRAGLRSLSEIPEHQLSNERLREAILARGLKPKPIRTMDLTWLWMSGAAAAFAVGLLISIQRLRSVNPQLVESAPTSIAATLQPSFTLKEAPKTVVAEAPKKAHSAMPGLTVAYRANARVRHHSRRARRDSYDGYMTYAILEPSASSPTAQDTSSQPQSPSAAAPDAPVPTSDLKPLDDKPAAPVVIIDSAQDQDTGAQRATEVETAGNVVVGG